MVLRWFLLLPIVLGGFLVAGTLGSLATAAVGAWHLPGAGFSAALVVVILAYVAAPAVKLQTAFCMLIVGGGIAWWLLEPSFYPESYRDCGAYLPTHLPLVATYLGGLLGLCAVLVDHRRRRAAH